MGTTRSYPNFWTLALIADGFGNTDLRYHCFGRYPIEGVAKGLIYCLTSPGSV